MGDQPGDKKTFTFYQNPFYDYLFGSSGVIVPSTRSGYKQDPVTKVPTPNPIPKGVHEFRNYIKTRLSNDAVHGWPCKGRLLIALSIGLTHAEYAAKDVDNVAKSILDALKGVAFTDDRQIDVLHVVKFQSDESSFFVAIKELSDDDPGWYYPELYKEEPWTDEQTYRLITKKKPSNS